MHRTVDSALAALVARCSAARFPQTSEVTLLLRFSTSNDRTEFLARLEREAPELYHQTKPSYAQPTVLIVSDMSRQDERRVRSLAEPFADAYADVQFDVCGVP